MKIFDAHCDVLYKMFLNPKINFKDSSKLQVTFEQLVATDAKVQCFAIYIPESIHPDMRFQSALYMVEIFYEKIIKAFPQLKLITCQEDITSLTSDQIGAVLTLEGCDAIGSDLIKLKSLIRLGVSSVGLTWNFANSVADGVLEERGAGLSRFGKDVLKILNETQTWCDVSHLSERGFWDVMEWGDYPVASHSNCYSLCPHPRNLTDDQIKAVIQRNSVIGITFVPDFLSSNQAASITDILRHLEHICSLGGEEHVGFGSDFDGIDRFVINLASLREYEALVNELLKYYPNKQVENFLFYNMVRRFPR